VLAQLPASILPYRIECWWTTDSRSRSNGSQFDAWDPAVVIEEAGVAAIEVQQWLAARSAAEVCGVRQPVVDLYVAAVEYRLAVGAMHAEPL
jgi:hypothetical protein